MITEQHENGIEQKIESILDNIEKIREEKIGRYKKAKDISWEKEGEKLKRGIADILE